MITQPQFKGMAHIVRPHAELPHHIGFETARAVQKDGNAAVKFWTQEFPYDSAYGEAIVLYGKDLEKAGNTDNWGFQEAFFYAKDQVRPNVTIDDTTTYTTGGKREESCTHTNGRASFYRHPRHPQALDTEA
jgi:hypothetical protein